MRIKLEHTEERLDRICHMIEVTDRAGRNGQSVRELVAIDEDHLSVLYRLIDPPSPSPCW